MKRSHKIGWSAELWVIAINLLLALSVLVLNWFFPSNEIPEGIEFLAVAVVSSVTATLLVIKNDIINRVTGQFDIYRLLESIEDDELYELGMERIDLCKRQLSDLSLGMISGSTADLLELLARKIKIASYIRVSHVAITTDEVHGWSRTSTAKNYYQANIRLLQEGKSVERVFVLRRRSFFDPHTGEFDAASKEVLEKQQKDGIKVYIAWEEDIIDRNLWEDFVILDSELVYINEPTGTVFAGGWKTLIKKNKQDVSGYIKKYDALIANYAQPLSQALIS